jgi:NADPH2:quinone reductase
MKAICVTPSRALELRDIPAPVDPAPGHVLIAMEASAINHGDKTFLKMPNAAGKALAAQQYNVWGASGAGTVIAVGAGVPAEYANRQVAIYRSLGGSPESVGLWCETVQVPYTSCLILPQHVRAKDYCGSLVNVITAHAFLEEIVAAGHQGVIVTAGNSATGRAIVALARSRKLSAIYLVRNEAARQALREVGAEHVLVTSDGDTEQLATLAASLGTTAVFDGVGGASLGKIIPSLPMNSSIYCYGLLDGATSFSMSSTLLMMKNLTIRRFSNFESATVKERDRLVAALKSLREVIDNPAFTTHIGQEFSYEQIEQAMAYESRDGGKAVLVA